MVERIYYYEDDRLKVMESLSRYLFSRGSLKDKSVLDIGCGARQGPSYIAETASRVVGMDISSEAVAYCRAHWPSPKITYLAGDAPCLPFRDGAFDAVLAFEVVEHLRRREDFLKETRRVLKNGGVCIVSTPNKNIMSPQGVFMNPDHVYEFVPTEFRDFLRAVFYEVEFYGQTSSARVGQLESWRRRSYEEVSRLSLFLRRLLPKGVRRSLFKRYADFRSRREAFVEEKDIVESDFPIYKNEVEAARYMIAVCRK